MTDAELREIDARVHAEVMGVVWDESRCRVCGWPIVPEGEDGCWSHNCSMRPPPDRAACEPPHYSSRMDLAWKVVEKLQADGYCIRLSNKQMDWCWWCYIYHGLDEIKAEAIVQEMTAPLAICLAALKSVRGAK